MRLIVISLATVAALAACTEQAPPSAPTDQAPAPAATSETSGDRKERDQPQLRRITVWLSGSISMFSRPAL